MSDGSNSEQAAVRFDPAALLPWRRAMAVPIGGLFQVGFSPGRDLLLVHSSQGRGIFDCREGTRLDRDDEEPMDSFDSVDLTAEGFGPLGNERIRMAGLFGGGLALTTSDGFQLEECHPRPGRRGIMLIRPDRLKAFAGDEGVCEMRAFGFSETGLSFVIATSCDLTVFMRPSPV